MIVLRREKKIRVAGGMLFGLWWIIALVVSPALNLFVIALTAGSDVGNVINARRKKGEDESTSIYSLGTEKRVLVHSLHPIPKWCTLGIQKQEENSPSEKVGLPKKVCACAYSPHLITCGGCNCE